jgi:hypothetical protein
MPKKNTHRGPIILLLRLLIGALVFSRGGDSDVDPSDPDTSMPA